MRFRDRYQLSVVGIWRGNRPVRTNLGDIPLQVGDALLLQGHRERFNLLEQDQQFVFIDSSSSGRELLRPGKAPFALAALGFMLLSLIMGWLSLSAAAVTTAVLIVLFGVLNMDEALQAIELRAVIIVASMLPLGNRPAKQWRGRLFGPPDTQPVRLSGATRRAGRHHLADRAVGPVWFTIRAPPS